jgi:hypothetical protein
VALVEGEDVEGAATHGEHDIRGVGQTEIQIGVPLDHSPRLYHVRRRERLETIRAVDETLSGAAMPWHGRTIEDERADTWRDLSIERGYPFY